MDSLISTAARDLAAGDALQALKRVALRDDPPALALRGIAMAQLGELAKARELLRRAAQGFGSHEPTARARCVVAEAEVALALRDFGDLSSTPRALDAAHATLEARGERANALQARLIAARRCLLLGRLDEAAALLAVVDTQGLPALPVAITSLAQAELALRSLRVADAQRALDNAEAAARATGIPTLQAEAAQARAVLDQPAARRVGNGEPVPLRLQAVAALLDSGALVVDACRHTLRSGDKQVPMASRPILFTLLRALAESWPGDTGRDDLIARAFRLRNPRDMDDTHRARLRVEIGRLRALISGPAGLADIVATPRGFALRPLDGREVAVLAPPVDGDQAELLALLADGAAWSTSALALALGTSQRTVQRELVELEAAGRVRAMGQTRARRWLAPPLVGFTTILLLPAALPLA
jgi:tetratricopeptide (TPR) repeat protein